MHTNDAATNHVEITTVPELIDQLRRWAETYSDAKDNDDARLLRRAARVLENQYGDIVRKNEVLMRQFRRHWTIVLKQQRLTGKEKREAEKWKRKFLRCRYRSLDPHYTDLKYMRSCYQDVILGDTDPNRRRVNMRWYEHAVLTRVKMRKVLPLP